MKNRENIIRFGEVDLILTDLESSETLHHLKREICDYDEYKIRDMFFDDGDIVIDIGANVGMVSIYLAKKFPNIKIYSFEAHPNTYSNFIKNIEANNVSNIFPHNLAVSSKDNELLTITLDIINTGSSSFFKDGGFMSENVNTICLDTIVKNNNIKKIKYLKIDCEGAEFDILENSNMINEVEIENIGIEIHSFMKSHGKDVESLKNLVKKISINNPHIKIYGS